jgi:hypothetical protein
MIFINKGKLLTYRFIDLIIYTFIYNISNDERKVLKNFLKKYYNPEILRISTIATGIIFGCDLFSEKLQTILLCSLSKFSRDLPKNFEILKIDLNHDLSKEVDFSKIEFLDEFYENCPARGFKFMKRLFVRHNHDFEITSDFVASIVAKIKLYQLCDIQICYADCYGRYSPKGVYLELFYFYR